jgi:hypothetical protein
MAFFQEIHVFLQLSQIGLFGTKCAFLPLNTPRDRQYSFPHLTQFTQRNKVLDALASNLDGFLSRDTCVSSTQLNRAIWNKLMFLPLENLDEEAVFLSKTNSIFTGKQCARCSSF